MHGVLLLPSLKKQRELIQGPTIVFWKSNVLKVKLFRVFVPWRQSSFSLRLTFRLTFSRNYFSPNANFRVESTSQPRTPWCSQSVSWDEINNRVALLRTPPGLVTLDETVLEHPRARAKWIPENIISCFGKLLVKCSLCPTFRLKSKHIVSYTSVFYSVVLLYSLARRALQNIIKSWSFRLDWSHVIVSQSYQSRETCSLVTSSARSVCETLTPSVVCLLFLKCVNIERRVSLVTSSARCGCETLKPSVV